MIVIELFYLNREKNFFLLFFGISIGAPRSYDFGVKRLWISSIIQTTTSLGRQVTATLEIASTDNSMLAKQYTDSAVQNLVGCKSTFLWKKLYSLKALIWPAQTLNGV